MNFKNIFSAVFAVGFFCLNLIFNVGKVSAEEIEEAPPISYTAPIALYWLSESGTPEAEAYINKIANGVDSAEYEKVFDLDDLTNVNASFAEIRYTASNEYAKRNGYKNVIDLGCGVSPHSVWTSRNKINYVGVDLPAVVNAATQYSKLFLNEDEQKFVSYKVADVTDTKAMLNTAKNLEGKVCIIQEGLAMYLSRSQQKDLLYNVRKILQEHGGVYITVDYNVKDLFTDIGKSLYNNKKAEELYTRSAGIYEEKGEADFEQTLFAKQKDAIDFIENQGLHVEIVPLLPKNFNLNVYSFLNKKQSKNLKSLTEKKYLWVMTAK